MERCRARRGRSSPAGPPFASPAQACWRVRDGAGDFQGRGARADLAVTAERSFHGIAWHIADESELPSRSSCDRIRSAIPTRSSTHPSSTASPRGSSITATGTGTRRAFRSASGSRGGEGRGGGGGGGGGGGVGVVMRRASRPARARLQRPGGRDLNGMPLYRGDDSYRSRDYRFLGSIGWFDTVYLPLQAGRTSWCSLSARASAAGACKPASRTPPGFVSWASEQVTDCYKPQGFEAPTRAE